MRPSTQPRRGEETASSGRRRRVEAGSGRLVLLGKSVRLQVFPNAGTLMADIVQAGFGGFLHQAFALAFIGNHDQLHFAIDMAFAIPIAAGCADLHFGRQYQFFCHLILDG